MSNDEENEDPLSPPYQAEALSKEVVTNRAASKAYEAARLTQASKVLEEHCKCYKGVVEELSLVHARVVEQLNFSLDERTRWSAIWIMSGRSLALANAYLNLVATGFGAESIPVARAMHEGLQLLDAFTAGGYGFDKEVPDEIRVPEEKRLKKCNRLLEKWLADKGMEYVKPSEAREAIHRSEEVLRAIAKFTGADPIPEGAKKQAAHIYDLMSRMSHNRRGGLGDSYSPTLREFSYGPHSSTSNWITQVSYSGTLIESLLYSMRMMFDLFVEEGWGEEARHLQDRIDRVRAEFPLLREGEL